MISNNNNIIPTYKHILNNDLDQNNNHTKQINSLSHGWIQLSRHDVKPILPKHKSTHIQHLQNFDLTTHHTIRFDDVIDYLNNHNNQSYFFIDSTSNMTKIEYTNYVNSIFNKLIENEDKRRSDFIELYGMDEYIRTFTMPYFEPYPDYDDYDSDEYDYEQSQSQYNIDFDDYDYNYDDTYYHYKHSF